MVAAELSIQLIVMVGIGFFAVRVHIVGEDFEKQLTSLIMKIFLPCMVVKSMMGTFSWDQLKNCGRLVLIAIVLWAVTFALAQLIYRFMGKTASARILRFCMIYANFTFVGIPVMEALYGDTGVFYFVVFVVPYRIIYYSSAEAMLSPPGLKRARRTWGERIRGWFSAPVVAVIVGLILYLTQLPLPSPVTGVISSLGSCASPMGMLLCGMTLGRYPIGRLLRLRYFRAPLARNLMIPALVLAACLLTGLERELAEIVVIFAALPVASLLAAFTIQYDPDKEAQFEAAAAVLLSTIFSAVTIPLWSAVLTLCYG